MEALSSIWIRQMGEVRPPENVERVRIVKYLPLNSISLCAQAGRKPGQSHLACELGEGALTDAALATEDEDRAIEVLLTGAVVMAGALIASSLVDVA